MGSHAGKLSSRVVQTELLRCFTSHLVQHFIKEACGGTHIMMCETDVSRCSDAEAKGGRKKQEEGLEQEQEQERRVWRQTAGAMETAPDPAFLPQERETEK